MKRICFCRVYLWGLVKRVVAYLPVPWYLIVIVIVVVIAAIVPTIVIVVVIVVVIVIVPPPILGDSSVYIELTMTISSQVVWFSTIKTFSLSLETLSSEMIAWSIWWVLVWAV